MRVDEILRSLDLRAGIFHRVVIGLPRYTASHRNATPALKFADHPPTVILFVDGVVG